MLARPMALARALPLGMAIGATAASGGKQVVSTSESKGSVEGSSAERHGGGDRLGSERLGRDFRGRSSRPSTPRRMSSWRVSKSNGV